MEVRTIAGGGRGSRCFSAPLPLLALLMSSPSPPHLPSHLLMYRYCTVCAHHTHAAQRWLCAAGKEVGAAIRRVLMAVAVPQFKPPLQLSSLQLAAMLRAAMPSSAYNGGTSSFFHAASCARRRRLPINVLHFSPVFAQIHLDQPKRRSSGCQPSAVVHTARLTEFCSHNCRTKAPCTWRSI
jgi:hypothetical protein